MEALRVEKWCMGGPCMSQDLLMPLIYAVYGAHINRDIVTLIAQSDFEITSVKGMVDGVAKFIDAVLPCRK